MTNKSLSLIDERAPWPRRGPDAIFPAQTKPRLAIVVHTEEEFDWDAPFDRAATGLTHMPMLGDFQERAADHGFSTHYSCGYPVAADTAATRLLKTFVDSGFATIGAHLHPWVCPPFDEEVNNHNSFPGNLPEATEKSKLTALTQSLEAAFGQRPTAYLAGRYGYGPNTGAILDTLGYRVDFSVAPGWDYRRYDGPNWRDHSALAFFNAEHPRLLHIPHSGGHIGFLTHGGLRRVKLDRGAGEALSLPSIAARIKAVRQTRLTLEGMRLEDMKTLCRNLFDAGGRLFTLSYHSPSAGIGFTPYAKTETDRQALLETLSAFLAFFKEDLGGCSATPEEMYQTAMQARGDSHEQAA